MAKPTIVTCPSCGAVYERRIEKLPVRDQDSFECTCGHTPERWSSSAFPIFLKIKDAPAKGTV
jgi:lysyl-tRNA synthetase class I